VSLIITDRIEIKLIITNYIVIVYKESNRAENFSSNGYSLQLALNINLDFERLRQNKADKKSCCAT
jgi:outer membrane usher protein FimD/PapC